MKKEIIINVGGELVKMEKISFKIARRIIPRKDSKWLTYFDGKHFFRFPKENNLEKILKQTELFLSQELTYSAKKFLSEFGFLGIHIYNNSLLFEERGLPEMLKFFKNALRAYIRDDKIFSLPDFNIEYRKDDFRGKRQNIIIGAGGDFLFFWLTQVFEEKVKLLECERKQCQKIFIPAKKGEGKNASRFCSEICRNTTYREKNKKLIKI